MSGIRVTTTYAGESAAFMLVYCNKGRRFMDNRARETFGQQLRHADYVFAFIQDSPRSWRLKCMKRRRGRGDMYIESERG